MWLKKKTKIDRAQVKEVIKEAISQVRKDGMYNARTRTGTRKDPSTHTRLVENSESEQTYEALYDISGIAKKIVNIFPKEATREWIEFTNLKKSDKEKFVKELKRLNFKKKFYNAARYAKLYGAGCLFIVDDTSLAGLKRPLRNPKTIKNLILFNNFNLEPSTELVSDINDPDFGLPRFYKIMSASREHQTNSKLQTFDIHRSRFLFVNGDEISKTSFENNKYFNYGILGKLDKAIRDWESSHDFIPGIISKYNLLILKMEGMVDTLTTSMTEEGDCKTGKNLIQEKVDDLDENITSLSIGIIDAMDDLKIQNPSNITGLKDLFERLDKVLIMQSDIPHTILAGESPMGSNATGNSTTLDWHNKIRIYQDNTLREPMNRFFNIVSSYLGINEFDFEFKPLWQSTEKEIAETKKITAETDEKYIDKGVLAPLEIRDSRFGGEIYSSDVTLGKAPVGPPVNKEKKKEDN